MTNEEKEKAQYTYNVIALHMLLQGEKSHRLLDSGAMQCSYRGENGNRCAIGFCIPNSKYHPSLEGGLSNEVIKAMGDEYYKEIFFLTGLQSIHDLAYASNWKKELKYFAKTYSLDDSILEVADTYVEDYTKQLATI